MVAANIMTLTVIGVVFFGVLKLRRSEAKSETSNQL
jgi:hypothetical protein